mgnify:CR=1 FL=1
MLALRLLKDDAQRFMDTHKVGEPGKPITRDAARPLCFPATEAANWHIRQHSSLLVRDTPFAEQIEGCAKHRVPPLPGSWVPAETEPGRFQWAATWP